MESETTTTGRPNNNNNMVLRLLTTKLLGPRATGKEEQDQETVIQTESLCGEGRILGLYFAAQWCLYSRTRTPQLKSFYETIKTTPQGSKFEIVFVSWDANETQFQECFSDMPWTALRYQDKTQRAQLAKLLQVTSIPTLVLLDGGTGTVITRNAVKHVIEDPGGTDFPWRPKTLETVLLKQGQLVDTTGQIRDPAEIEDQIKCLYFSANWCPPCKAFTPQLVSTYSRLKSKGHKFEVVFVSSDRSQESFDQYFGTMPWLAIPYVEDQRRKELAQLLGVQGIPTLVIVDEKNEILTRDGRYEVTDDPEGNNFPWRPHLVEELTDKFASKLHDPFLILFTDGNEAELDQARTMLLPIAEELAMGHNDDLLRFFVGGDAAICDHLREHSQLEDEIPLLVIFETTMCLKYVLEDDVELTEEVIRDFVRRYFEGTLKSELYSD